MARTWCISLAGSHANPEAAPGADDDGRSPSALSSSATFRLPLSGTLFLLVLLPCLGIAIVLRVASFEHFGMFSFLEKHLY